MSLELCILASGSTGNCSVVRAPAGVLLIDAGIGPRITTQRLNGTGVSLRDVRAICLTHLDGDHFRHSWLRTIVQNGIRLCCHESRRGDLLESAVDDAIDRTTRRRFAGLVHGFDGESFEPLPGLRMRPIRLDHDRHGSHGFTVESSGWRLGYASDLGHVPRELVAHFAGANLVALESNYDPTMELQSRRPWFLKNRIMGGRGHLSNEQAFAAVRAILDHCQRRNLPFPEHIVLLHRSRECNCPKLLRRLFSRDPRIAPRLTLAEAFQRSEWLRPTHLRPTAGEQLVLSW